MSRWKSSKTCNEPITLELPTIERPIEKESQFFQTSGNKLYFYSDVNKDTIYILNRQIDELTKQLKNIQFSYNLSEPPPIELYISSEGGEIFSALSTVDRILTNPVPVNTHVEGITASAATLISVVGKKRTMSQNSMLLIHQISTNFWGTFSELEDEFKNSTVIMKVIKNIYLKYTKFQEQDLEDMLKHDLCLSSDECIKFGLVDSII